MKEKIYIIKVGKVYLANDFDNIGKYNLCDDPTKGIKIYTNEDHAKHIAEKIGGEVMVLKEGEV